MNRLHVFYKEAIQHHSVKFPLPKGTSNCPVCSSKNIIATIKTKTANEKDPTYCHEANLNEKIPALSAFLNRQTIQDYAQMALASRGHLLHAKFMDKPPGSTWQTGWHQDRSPHDMLRTLLKHHSLKALASHLGCQPTTWALLNTLSQ